MQSGITASEDLHTAFADFTSNASLFALPITIASERLTPLPAVPSKASADADASFASSLPLLEPHVQPRTPIYLLLRKTRGGNDVVAVTYIPSNAPVRAKTLFASTRATLVKELGIEGGTLFATESAEVLDPREWEERDRRDGAGTDDALLTREERELQGVKRAEDEERHGTKGRDLMGSEASSGAGGGKSVGVAMKMDDAGKEPLRELAQCGESEEGMVVQFGIDLSTESLQLNFSDPNVAPSDLATRIPSDVPSYTFYHYPATSSVVFVYTCPGSSKVKERMVYSTSKRSVLEVARTEGVDVLKSIEVGGPEEVTAEMLRDEVQPKSDGAAASKQGFARPKRPGKRAPVSVLLKSRALEAVESVTDAFSATDNALVLVVPEGTLVADANKRGRAYVGVADRALAVALVAEPSEGDACLLAAHNEIGMMARHGGVEIMRERSERRARRLLELMLWKTRGSRSGDGTCAAESFESSRVYGEGTNLNAAHSYPCPFSRGTLYLCVYSTNADEEAPQGPPSNMSNMIASAVVVPEPENLPKQTSPSLKRRQSSLDSESSKRPRLDTRTSQYSNDDRSPTSAMSPPRRKSSAIGSGAAEERKRGQRLFGALLGTLSQTSAKPAHRRRDEIEKRQQDKLRQKDEELADEKRRKREELDAVRRKEQKVWDRQGLTIKHQNMQATAHFLRTTAEPSLYYRPWDLRSEEDEQIKKQIEDTERLIEKELAEASATDVADPGPAEVPHSPKPSPDSAEPPKPDDMDVTVEEKEKPELVGEATNEQKAVPDPHATNNVPIEQEQPEVEKKVEEKAHDDHGGEELVEGQEDDVIY